MNSYLEDRTVYCTNAAQPAVINPLMNTLKPQSNSNTAIGIATLWPLMSGLLYLVQQGRAQSPPRCTKCNRPPTNGQCTNFILFDAALHV